MRCKRRAKKGCQNWMSLLLVFGCCLLFFVFFVFFLSGGVCVSGVVKYVQQKEGCPAN